MTDLIQNVLDDQDLSIPGLPFSLLLIIINLDHHPPRPILFFHLQSLVLILTILQQLGSPPTLPDVWCISICVALKQDLGSWEDVNIIPQITLSSPCDQPTFLRIITGEEPGVALSMSSLLSVGVASSSRG